MAHKHNLGFVLLLLATNGLGQTTDSQARSSQTNRDQPQPVALARCAYSQADGSCPGASVDPMASDSHASSTLPPMQHGSPRRMAGPPMRGPVYPETWGPQFSPGHALIGAAIGFGFGAAAGSKNGVRTSIAAGTLIGLLGAALGAGIPSFPHYRRRGWDDDEEASLRKRKPVKPSSSHPDPATQVAASQPGPERNISKE